MPFCVVVYQSKRHWSNDDMCHSLTQTTSFSTDFETLQEKQNNMLNQVNASVELLEYLCDSTVLPQSFDDKFAMCTFLTIIFESFQQNVKSNIW